jgi:putative SOS response-associated peptidase YedK
MCGRYTLHANKKKLAEAIALALPEDFEPEYNIGPGREILSLSQRDECPPALGYMHWGLKTPQNFHINARIETADTAPRFRESWELYRCLVPASGFFEWYADGVTKQPYYIAPKGSEVSFFAGLWFPSAREGLPGTCILLTTEASAPIQPIHRRMPVILPPSARDSWLGNRLSKAEAVALANEIDFEHHTVSQRVNNVRNNDSSLIQATAPLHDDQMMLF